MKKYLIDIIDNTLVSWGRVDACLCMAKSFCCSPETHNIVNWLYPNTKCFLVLKTNK